VKTIVFTIPNFVAMGLQQEQVGKGDIWHQTNKQKSMMYTYPEAKEEIPAIMLHTNNKPPRNNMDTP